MPWVQLEGNRKAGYTCSKDKCGGRNVSPRLAWFSSRLTLFFCLLLFKKTWGALLFFDCRFRIVIVPYGKDGSTFGMVFFDDMAWDLVGKPVDVLNIGNFTLLLLPRWISGLFGKNYFVDVTVSRYSFSMDCGHLFSCPQFLSRRKFCLCRHWYGICN